MNANRSVLAIMVFAAFGVALFLGCSEEGKQGVVDAPKRAGGEDPGLRVSKEEGKQGVVDVPKRAGREDPGFRVSRGEFSDERMLRGLYWTITNTLNTPLTVTRVTYNGDWEAPRAEVWGAQVGRVEAGLPVQLTIGEACHFFQYRWGDEPRSYTKEIIYIDIETDRGTFRYRTVEARIERCG